MTTAALNHNGGNLLMNLPDVALGGAWPFLNYLKQAGSWDWAIGTTPATPVDPAILDSNGYPTSIVNGGVATQITLPRQADRPGAICVMWDGTGQISVGAGGSSLGTASFTGSITGNVLTTSSVTGTIEQGQLVAATGIATYTIIMSQLTGTVGGAGTYTVSVSQSLASRAMTVSGGSMTSSGGANAGYYASKNEGVSYNFKITGGGAPYITNAKVFHVDDAALVVAGETFGVKFKQRLIEGNFGILRGMGWVSNNTTNVTYWRTRKPVSYFSYGTSHYDIGIFCGSTTNVGNAYTVGAPSLDSRTGGAWSGLADKVTVTVRFNVDATQSGLCSLNVGGTGAINILSEYTTPLSIGGNSYPRGTANSNGYSAIATLMYDATLNAWIKLGGDDAQSRQGIDSGVPVELLLQLCAEVGAHPWFVAPAKALDNNPTDYMGSLAAYVLANKPSWMVPRFEGPNELWNTAPGFFNAGYAQIKQSIFNGCQVPGGVVTVTNYNASTVVYPSASLGPGFSDITLSTTGNSYKVGSAVALSGFTGLNSFPSVGYVAAINVGGNVNKITVDVVPTSGSYTSGGTVSPRQDDVSNWYGAAFSTMGQAITSILGAANLGKTYHIIIGGQAGAGTSTVDPIVWGPRFTSKAFVMSNTPPSGYTATAARLYYSHTCVANYVRPFLTPDATENALSTLFGGFKILGSISSGTLTLTSILTNKDNGISLTTVSPALRIGQTIWGRGIGGPFDGVKITGGSGTTWTISSSVTIAADNFFLCDVPEAALTYVDALNAPVASAFNLKQLDNIVTNWVAFITPFVNTNGVAGKLVAYEGGYSPDYDSFNGGSTYQVDVLRYAGKFAPRLGAYMLAQYSRWIQLGALFPSDLIMSGTYPTSSVWGVLEDIYQTPDPPQWQAFRQFGSITRASQAQLRLHS